MGRRPGLLRRMDDTGVPLLVARLVLAVLFLKMGLAKMLDPIDFLKLVREYHMLPDTPPYFLNLMAVVLPSLEVVCAIVLLAGISVRGAALTLVGMLVVFTTAVLLRSLAIHAQGGIAYCAIKFDCGCGAGEVYICRKLLENAGLVLLSLLAVASRSRRFSLSARLWRGARPMRAPS
jgi:uncharacterized membrane protein YphA (DoxX/SURF4 family)